MADNKSYNATVRATGQKITVYKIHSRGTWCDMADSKTEYQEHELIIEKY